MVSQGGRGLGVVVLLVVVSGTRRNIILNSFHYTRFCSVLLSRDISLFGQYIKFWRIFLDKTFVLMAVGSNVKFNIRAVQLCFCNSIEIVGISISQFSFNSSRSTSDDIMFVVVISWTW